VGVRRVGGDVPALRVHVVLLGPRGRAGGVEPVTAELPGEEWRVEVDLDDEQHGFTLSERLRARHVDDQARERLGGRVIVTRDGPRLYLYAATAAGAREAERVIQELLEADRLTAEVRVTRWDEATDDWRPPDEPAEEEAVAAAQHVDHDWFVVAEPPDDADRLADRLRADGLAVERRWRYLVIGASSEEDANAIAARVRADAGAGTKVEVRAQTEDVASPGFMLLERFTQGL
jgi:hypothetical protein